MTKYATRESIEAVFLGKLCNVIPTADQAESDKYYSQLSQKEKGYVPTWKVLKTNYIDEVRIDKNWWAKGGGYINFCSTDVVLVVDILRNLEEGIPVWSTASLYEGKFYLINVDRLLLSEKNK